MYALPVQTVYPKYGSLSFDSLAFLSDPARRCIFAGRLPRFRADGGPGSGRPRGSVAVQTACDRRHARWRAAEHPGDIQRLILDSHLGDAFRGRVAHDARIRLLAMAAQRTIAERNDDRPFDYLPGWSGWPAQHWRHVRSAGW